MQAFYSAAGKPSAVKYVTPYEVNVVKTDSFFFNLPPKFGTHNIGIYQIFLQFPPTFGGDS